MTAVRHRVVWFYRGTRHTREFATRSDALRWCAYLEGHGIRSTIVRPVPICEGERIAEHVARNVGSRVSG